MADSDYLHSSRRENLIEHLFIGDLLRHLWLAKEYEVDILRAETDASGYDIVVEASGISRHIQLKSSTLTAVANSQKVNIALSLKSSGCVIWVMFDPATLQLGPFGWFGDEPGKPLPDISSLRVAKHTRANSDGEKAERPNIRVIPKGKFVEVSSMGQLVKKLFG